MHITGFKTYMQRVDDRPRLLLKIETSEGISGWGECYNHGPDWALPVDRRITEKATATIASTFRCMKTPRNRSIISVVQ